MVNRNIDSILYQSNLKLGDLAYTLAKNDFVGAGEETINQNKIWTQAINVYNILKVIYSQIELSNGLYYRSLNITDEELNTLLAKLVNIANIVNYPIVQSLLLGPVPTILTGLPGDDGQPGATGAQGPAGYATDFQSANKTSNTVVDSFLVSAAKAVRWDYFVIDNSGNQRASSLIYQWSADGSIITGGDTIGTDDIGNTSNISFDVQYSSGNINLIAQITSGTWTIVGTRYFIPNNGNGSGAVNNVLPLGQMYIGNNLNQATPQTISQDATVNAAGQLLISAGAVNNAKIAANAGILMTKLAALTANRVTITDVNGFIIASTILTSELANLAGSTGNIQAQLNAIAVGLLANRPVITNGSGALTSNPLPSTNRVIKWNGTQFADSLIQDDGTTVTINGLSNAVLGDTGYQLRVKKINIGDWNMSTTSGITIAHGIGNRNKIKTVLVKIIPDVGTGLTEHFDLISPNSGVSPNIIAGSIRWDDSNITLQRQSSGYFTLASNFINTSFNRGEAIIFYEP